MGQILHGCARTTEIVRREIQKSQESLSHLSERYGINIKTVQKGRVLECGVKGGEAVIGEAV